MTDDFDPQYDPIDDEDTVYRITQKGYEEIWSWLRLTAQMHELECTPQGIDIVDDECPLEHRVALTLVFVLPPLDRALEMGMFNVE